MREGAKRTFDSVEAEAYNRGVSAILKSLAFAVVAAALCFGLFMMLSIPGLMIFAKLRGADAPLQAPGVILSPTVLFRSVGLPLSVAAFVVCFALGMKKFRAAARPPR